MSKERIETQVNHYFSQPEIWRKIRILSNKFKMSQQEVVEVTVEILKDLKITNRRQEIFANKINEKFLLFCLRDRLAFLEISRKNNTDKNTGLLGSEFFFKKAEKLAKSLRSNKARGSNSFFVVLFSLKDKVILKESDMKLSDHLRKQCLKTDEDVFIIKPNLLVLIINQDAKSALDRAMSIRDEFEKDYLQNIVSRSKLCHSSHFLSFDIFELKSKMPRYEIFNRLKEHVMQ